MYSRILSLDPGTNNTGISVIDVDANGLPLVVFATTINSISTNYLADVYGDRYCKIKYIGDKLSHYLNIFAPTVIISESPYLGRFPQSFSALVETLHEFRNRVYIYNSGLPLETIDPSSVKKFMGVKGTSGDKALMYKALSTTSTQYGQDVNPLLFDEHTVDAICVGLYMFNIINR